MTRVPTYKSTIKHTSKVIALTFYNSGKACQFPHVTSNSPPPLYLKYQNFRKMKRQYHKEQALFHKLHQFLQISLVLCIFPCILLKVLFFEDRTEFFSAKMKYPQFFALQVKVINGLCSNLDRRLLHNCSLCIRKHLSYKLVVTKLLIKNHMR